MTQKPIKSFAPGLTAIAAVLALHATPIAAQEVDPSSTILSPPAPTPDPAPVASDPLAPEAQATTAPEPEAAAPAAATSRASRTRAASRTAARASVPSTPRQAAASAPVAAAPAPASEPAPPTVADPAAVPPPPEPAVAPAPEPVATDAVDEYLPIAGAAGAGLLALAGLGLAVRRRRRKREEEEQWAYDEAPTEQPVAAEPEPVMARPEPAPAAPLTAAPVAAAAMTKPRGDTVSAFTWGNQSFARPTPQADPIPVKETATNLPEGFDLSRFGRHVQAAYKGPTADNPSLSLKNRLRRASYFDKVERDTGKPHPLVAGELEHQH